MAEEPSANQSTDHRQDTTNQILRSKKRSPTVRGAHTLMHTHPHTHAVLVQGLLVRCLQVCFYGNGEAPGLILPRLDDLVDKEAER